MREEIRRIQQETKVTTIFVTHDQEEAMAISDKIVLMKDGFLKQVDKPQELYDDPHNIFVASFIGNPPINLIEGFVEGETFSTKDGKASVKLDGENYERQEAILGIRAEAIVLDDEDYDFIATIKQAYTIGKEEIAHIQIGEEIIKVYLSSDYNCKNGDVVKVKLRRKGSFVFSKESGDRI